MTSYTDLMVAQGAAYLGAVDAKFHTNVRFVSYPSSNAAEPGFLSGDEFTVDSAASWLPPVLKGKSAVALFPSFVGMALVFVAAEKYQQSRGSDVASYAKSTWCDTGPNSGSANALAALAGANGLNPSKLNVVSVGGVAAFLPSIQSGRCDIVTMDTTHAAIAVEQGLGYILANTNDPAVFKKLAGNQLGNELVTTPAFIQKYPALVQAIVTAEMKALLFVKKHAADPATIYAALPSEFTSTSSEQSFAQQFALGAPSFTGNTGLMSTQQIDDTLALLVKYGVLTSVSQANSAETFNSSFAKQAYKQLGQPTPAS